VRAGVGSALYAPIRQDDGDALIVLVSERQGAFSRDHLAHVDRFSTFANQTMTNVRSRELRETNRELKRARDEAERAREAQFRFLATMSHELRTPMTGILGMLTLLEDTELTAAQRSYLEPLQHSANSLLELLNDILDTSKIEAGELQIERLPFDLRACVARHLPILKETVAASGLAFHTNWDGPENALFVAGDAMRLQQVVTNLVNNAAKFTEVGSVTLTLRADAGPRDVHLTCEVTDTGPGIPAEQQQRIFKPFTQRDDGMTRRYGGTGLGLAICRELVEAMDGSIGVRSDVGRGSTFWFDITLPLSEPIEVPPPQMPADVVRVSRRLLVAEDNPTNQFLLESWLGNVGHDVTIVANGQEAVEALAKNTYDAVFLDMHMPVMDGPTATRVIRAMPGVGEIPIYALTADAMSALREQHMAAGLDGYLTKPIDFEAMDRIIASLPTRDD
jgi:signal transduction histidine kinase/CheY-like chemotaxis protein